MGLTKDTLGLPRERQSADFLEPRPCPHKGIDITSSNSPKPFKSGVFGTVTSPIGGKWGTISVRPFDNPRATIQYIHCSSSNVQPGDFVAPWTTIGVTGNKVDSNVSKPVPIHLHVHVEAPYLASYFTCWKGRSFTDPNTFPTPDYFAGTWFNTRNGATPDGKSWTWNARIRFSGSSVGASASITDEVIFTDSACTWRARSFASGAISAQTLDPGIRVKFGGGRLQSNQCGGWQFDANLPPIDLQLKIVGPNRLEVPPNYAFWNRSSSRFLENYEVERHAVHSVVTDAIVETPSQTVPTANRSLLASEFIDSLQWTSIEKTTVDDQQPFEDGAGI